MALRSILITPCRSDALAKARLSRADALLIELSGGADLAEARATARAALADRRDGDPRLILALSGLEAADDDLAAVMAAAPEAIWLPRCRSGADVQQLSVKLAAHEALCGLADGATRIYAAAAASAAALFQLSTYLNASARLSGLAFEADALAADLGGIGPPMRDSGPLALARDLTLLAARAAAVVALDAAASLPLDLELTRAETERARRHGFTGKLARDPAEVTVINAVFG